MHWLPLPVAAFALWAALRTNSLAAMSAWLLLAAALIGLWLWLRYRALFPPRNTVLGITPLDEAELARMREQGRSRTTVLGIPAATPAASAPPAPVAASAQPPAPSDAPSALPVAGEAEPPRGRAVFTLPDEPPRPLGVIEPDDRAQR
ncbi:hypothetical protein [Luteimonas sp. e5]